jgi:hypothetical protein
MYVILLLLLFASCTSRPLHVQSEYFRRQDLASYIVDTPDPAKSLPVFGQRLRISWSVTKKEFKSGPLSLEITVRLKNGEKQFLTKALDAASGECLFEVTGENYTEKGGILSYRVDLLVSGKPIAERHHRFWVEEITVKDS